MGLEGIWDFWDNWELEGIWDAFGTDLDSDLGICGIVELKGIWDALGLAWDLGSGLCWPICIRDE